MNPDQLAYLLAAFRNENYDIYCFALGLKNMFAAGLNMGKDRSRSQYFSRLASLNLRQSAEFLDLRRRLAGKIKMVKDLEKTYPAQFADKIYIDDGFGLEHLLEQTSYNERLEWGTVLRSASDKEGRIVVNEIKDSYEAEEEGYVTSRGVNFVVFDSLKMKKDGYNGMHHYHVSRYGQNFAVNPIDRNTVQPDGINLLTFNCDDPEIIAFNMQFVYIPKTRDGSLESKKELVRATPMDVWRYLER